MKKSIGSVFLAFVVLTVLLSGCAPASTPVPPTATSIPPTKTSVPPSATPTSAPILATPKAGQWEGEDIWGNHHLVTFSVSADGKITNFTLVQKMGGNFTCTMTLDPIDVTDGAFSNFAELSGGDKQGVSGSFDSAETGTGVATQHTCNEGGELISSGSYDVKWSAKWIGD